MLQEVQGLPGELHELKTALRTNDGQYRTDLEDSRRQRYAIEGRLVTEGHMFERYLL